jgi:drug/metabolite transporter (DMT)-like permease
MEDKVRPYNGNQAGAAQFILAVMAMFGGAAMWGIYSYLTLPSKFWAMFIAGSLVVVVLLALLLKWLTHGTETTED